MRRCPIVWLMRRRRRRRGVLVTPMVGRLGCRRLSRRRMGRWFLCCSIGSLGLVRLPRRRRRLGVIGRLFRGVVLLVAVGVGYECGVVDYWFV